MLAVRRQRLFGYPSGVRGSPHRRSADGAGSQLRRRDDRRDLALLTPVGMVKLGPAALRLSPVSLALPFNARGMSAVEYARRLWLDGTKKGWLAPAPEA